MYTRYEQMFKYIVDNMNQVSHGQKVYKKRRNARVNSSVGLDLEISI